MTKVAPRQIQASLKAAQKDGVVTTREAARLPRALLQDLAESPDGEATLRRAAENLRAFLEPFRARDSQEEGGVWLDRSVRYGITDLANGLSRAAEELESLKAGTFEVALGLSLQDQKLTVAEARDLGALARKLVDEASDPAAAARAMRGALQSLEVMFAQAAVFGAGPARDEVISKSSSSALARLNTFLGNAIAKGLGEATPGGVAPDSDFARGVADIVGADPMARRMLLETLPHLVDGELGVYDSRGLTGPAKLAMDRQAEARGRALLAHVDALAASGTDVEDVQQALFRMVTGRFLPEAQEAELLAMMKDMPADELREGLAHFQEQAARLEGAASLSVQNEVKGLREGISLIEAELARRADASGLSSIGDAASARAVLAFLKADPNVAGALADGATIDEASVKTFTWAEAKEAVKHDHGAGVDLDVVLQNMTGDGTLFARDMPEHFAFARVAIALGDDRLPVTVVLQRKEGGFVPVRLGDGGIPFDA